MAVVHVARARGTPRAADDAKAVRAIPLGELQAAPPKFAFDHGEIVDAYLEEYHPRQSGWKSGGKSGGKSGVKSGGKSRAPGVFSGYTQLCHRHRHSSQSSYDGT